MVPVVVGDDVAACRAPVKPRLALYVGGMGARGRNFYNDLARRYGYEEAAGRIQELYLAGRKDEAEAAVPDALVDEVALCGPPERIRERLAARGAGRGDDARVRDGAVRGGPGDGGAGALRRGGAAPGRARRGTRAPLDQKRRRASWKSRSRSISASSASSEPRADAVVAADRDHLHDDLGPLAPSPGLVRVAPGIRMGELAPRDLLVQLPGALSGGVLRQLARAWQRRARFGAGAAAGFEAGFFAAFAAGRAAVLDGLLAAFFVAERFTVFFATVSLSSSGDFRVVGSIAALCAPNLRAERPERRPHEMIHRKDLERERREPEIAGDGHLEEADGGEDRHAHVLPLGQRPVVPELPEEAADDAGQEPPPDEGPVSRAPRRQERRPAGAGVQGVEEEHEAEPHEAEGPRPHVVREERRHRHEDDPDDDRETAARGKGAGGDGRSRARGGDRRRAAPPSRTSPARWSRTPTRTRSLPPRGPRARRSTPSSGAACCTPRTGARAESTRWPSAGLRAAGRGGGSGPRAGGPERPPAGCTPST